MKKHIMNAVRTVCGIGLSLAMVFIIPAVVGAAFLCAGYHDVCPFF